ncbi:MAG: hypothetical protein ABIJ10_06220 [Candidatus Micrarchaeota archaeon]
MALHKITDRNITTPTHDHGFAVARPCEGIKRSADQTTIKLVGLLRKNCSIPAAADGILSNVVRATVIKDSRNPDTKIVVLETDDESGKTEFFALTSVDTSVAFKDSPFLRYSYERLADTPFVLENCTRPFSLLKVRQLTKDGIAEKLFSSRNIDLAVTDILHSEISESGSTHYPEIKSVSVVASTENTPGLSGVFVCIVKTHKSHDVITAEGMEISTDTFIISNKGRETICDFCPRMTGELEFGKTGEATAGSVELVSTDGGETIYLFPAVQSADSESVKSGAGICVEDTERHDGWLKARRIITRDGMLVAADEPSMSSDKQEKDADLLDDNTGDRSRSTHIETIVPPASSISDSVQTENLFELTDVDLTPMFTANPDAITAVHGEFDAETFWALIEFTSRQNNHLYIQLKASIFEPGKADRELYDGMNFELHNKQIEHGQFVATILYKMQEYHLYMVF